LIFQATITEGPRGGAHVEVPPEVVAALGGKSRIPVWATFDGIAYRGSIARMGGGSVLGLLKSIRTQLAKAPGDQVEVSVEVDGADRAIPLPDDLVAALVDADIRPVFDALSYTHQREYVTWIEQAKQPSTRARRIGQTIKRVGA
jgi:hypothetical protein